MEYSCNGKHRNVRNQANRRVMMIKVRILRVIIKVMGLS
jgi:hypothetical protein